MTEAGQATLTALRLPPGPPTARAVERAWDRREAALPVPAGWPEPAVEALLAETRPSRLVTPAGEEPLSGGLPVPAGTALVVATSGTTGRPRAVVLSHASLEASARASLDRLGLTGGDRWLCCLPLWHVAGVQVLVRSRLLGTEPVVHPRFDVAAVADAAAGEATAVSLVPTMLVRLLDAGVDLTRVRILLGGARPEPALLHRAAAAGARVTTGYGLTETCGGCVYDGRPLDGVEVALRDGRVAVRGPVLMTGYRNRPDLTAEVLRDGWLITPDQGHWTAEGRLEVTGRADDVIVTGGENVPAGEVARVLEDHPAVAEAAVAGAPDPEWGQRVVAVCVAADPAAPPQLAALRRHVADRLGPAAAPRELRLVGALPRTDLGKVDRRRLLDEAP